MHRPGNHSGGGITPAVGRSEAEFVFLAVEHPGIPDAEILDKLLDAGSVLLTGDRVLHNLALGRGKDH